MTGKTKVAVTALTAAMLACSHGAEMEKVQQSLSTRAPVYLALGDSVAFGWHDGIADPWNPHWFVGYANYLAELIDLPLVNAACPSEASGSFLDTRQPDDGCRDFKDHHPLHVEYDSTQLEYALSFVAAHPRLRLVTLQLGANDLQLMVKYCMTQLDPPACIASEVQGRMAALVGNVVKIVSSLRGAGYRGQILVIDYYVPNTDPTYSMLIGVLDQALAVAVAAAGELLGPIALVDVHTALANEAAKVGGDPCATGLIHQLPDGTCEIHPSEAGYRLIAQLIADQVEPRD